MQEFNLLAKKRMKELNLNVTQLAEQIDVCPQHLYSLFSGKRRWNSETLLQICNKLGIKIKFEVVPEAC